MQNPAVVDPQAKPPAQAKTTNQTTPEGDYDPHSERKVELTLTDFETFVHLLKACVGTGILSMPVAFSYVGLVAGSFLTVFLGILCSHGIQLLIKTEYTLCKRQKVAYLAYPDAMKVAISTGPTPLRCLARPSPYIVNGFFCFYQIGICTAYLVFVSLNVKSVVEHYSDICWPLRVYMCIFFLGCLTISYVPNLKLFAPFSLVANLFIITGIIIILYYVFQDFPSPSERKMIQPLIGWMRFVGICFFALASVGVVVGAEYEMRNPKHFCGMLGMYNIAIMTVTVLYWLVGFVGYIKYGEEVASTIPLNLPDGWLTSTCRLLICTAILVSFGLQLMPACDVILQSYVKLWCETASKVRLWIYTYIVRTVVALIGFAFALASDKNLELVLNLLGVVCITMLGFSFPALMHLCTHWPGQGLQYYAILAKDLAFVIGGVLLMILGLYVNIASTIDEAEGKAERC